MPQQTFEEWLEERRQCFREIETEIHSIEDQLHDERDRRTVLLQIHKETTQEAGGLGSRGGAYAQSGDGLRLTARHLALLTHSVEVAFAPSYVLRRMGVDLTNLVPPQVIEYSPGNRASITQEGDASLVLNNSDSCHAVGIDQLGIDVPIRSEILGSVRNFSLHAVVQSVISRAQSELSILPSRQPRLCPPDALPTEQRLGMVAFAARSFAGALGQTVTPPADFDLGLSRPTYESVGVFDFFRIFGVTEKRPRGALPFLTSLPDWADTGVKVASSVFVDKVRKVLADNGASLVDGPHFRPGNRFEMTGELKTTVQTRIACVSFGAHIRVRVRLDCSLRVIGTNKIQFIAAQIGQPDVDVTTFPYLVPGLQNLIDLALGEIIERKIPNIRLSPDPFVLGLATRIEIDLDSTRLAIYASLRF